MIIICLVSIAFSSQFTNAINGGVGATVPYITYEAEAGVRGGGAELLAVSNRERGNLAGEASGRAAVRLGSTGAYVEFEVQADANSIVARCAMPNVGLTDTRTLSVYAGSTKVATLTLTSRYTNLCGSESEPNKCGPGQDGFHLYDDAKALFSTTVRRGEKIRVQKDSGDTAPFYAVDFIDLEMVAPPKEMPSGFVNIVDFGAVEGQNCADAINKSIHHAVNNKMKGIWFPRGNWGMHYINGVEDTGKIMLPAAINSHPTKFEIAGAGMWYSKIYAMQPGRGAGAFDDWGRNWGFDCQGQTVYYHDFFMDGENRIRTEGGKPLVNGYGQNTVIENVWVEHSTIGFWVGGADRSVGQDFPAGMTKEQKQSKGMIIRNCRCRNTGADGINLCAGTTDAIVEHTNCRSNGDDGLAIWSEKDAWVDSDVINPGGCQNNTIRFCTVELTWRANGIGIYGGKNNRVEDCLVRDILTYMGIMIDSETHPCVKATGTLVVTRCTFLRTSGIFWSQIWPAIGVYKNPGQQVLFDDILVTDTFYGAFRFEGPALADFNNMIVDGFCKYTGPEPPSLWGMGFIGPFGTGNVNFVNITQMNWGQKGESFYGNPRRLNEATYHIGAGCNFDYEGPL